MDENEIDASSPLRNSYDATHLSDVIDVIRENDPDFRESTSDPARPLPSSMSYNGGGEIPLPPQPQHPPNTGDRRRQQAYVRIIEQPASKALRFRYECEGRSAGSIPGASSTPENKTYPEIQVEGYRGKAVVVVSCVMKDPPYAVHPHKLVGREGCRKGVCTLHIPPDTMRVQFSNLGIQCVKKRDIESSLRTREEIKVDPFRQHYHHKNQPTSIDLNAVRLCFQVFIEGDTPGKYSEPLKPVVSDIIYDKKAMSDLTIIKLSHCVSYVNGGGKDIILLCEKVAKEDIEIHFFEMENDKRVWSAKADFQPSQVHKQHAIWFKTPRYKTLDVTEPVKVFIQLYRPSDQVTSEPLPFELLPVNSVSDKDFKRKRPKFDHSDVINRLSDQDRMAMQHTLQTPLMEPIKIEPRDSTSPYDGTHGVHIHGYMYPGASPNYSISLALSPAYMEAPSPENINIQYRQQVINHQNQNYNIMPPFKNDQPSCSTWNIPINSPSNMPNIQGVANMQTVHMQACNMQQQQIVGNCIMDLDNHQISSGDLANTLNDMTIPPGQLPEIQMLSLTDIIPIDSSESLTSYVNDVATKELS